MRLIRLFSSFIQIGVVPCIIPYLPNSIQKLSFTYSLLLSVNISLIFLLSQFLTNYLYKANFLIASSFDRSRDICRYLDALSRNVMQQRQPLQVLGLIGPPISLCILSPMPYSAAEVEDLLIFLSYFDCMHISHISCIYSLISVSDRDICVWLKSLCNGIRPIQPNLLC